MSLMRQSCNASITYGPASVGTHTASPGQREIPMETNQDSCSQSIISDPFTITLIRIKARQLCRRSDFSRSDYDDLRQDMRLYLLRREHLFDPVRGNLEAFVTTALCTWVAMWLRYRNRDRRRESCKAVSLERTPVECDGDITTLGAVLAEADGRRLTRDYPISALEHVELQEDVKRVVGDLSSADRAILNQVVEHGIAATARSIGVSWRQVKNTMRRIRAHFRKSGLGPK